MDCIIPFYLKWEHILILIEMRTIFSFLVKNDPFFLICCNNVATERSQAQLLRQYCNKWKNIFVFSWKIRKMFEFFSKKMKRFQLLLLPALAGFEVHHDFSWFWVEISLGLNQFSPGFDMLCNCLHQVYYGIVSIRNIVWTQFFLVNKLGLNWLKLKFSLVWVVYEV